MEKERTHEIQSGAFSGDLSKMPFNMRPCENHVTFLDGKVDGMTSLKRFKNKRKWKYMDNLRFGLKYKES